MTERSNQPQNPPAGIERPEVYSISQDKDGSFHFSRKGFLYFSAALGGTLLLRGVCPRFGAKSAPSEPGQAGMVHLPRVYIHAAPSITSNIADTLQQNDFVRLISDHPDLGWVEVATRSGQRGWMKRSFVDFSRAIKSSSRNFDLSNTLTQPNTQTQPDLAFSTQLRDGDTNPKKVFAAEQAQSCGEVIQNGDFEAGSVSWVEESTGTIISTDWPDPYQGSWVAWLGGLDAVERLTQLFHVPEEVEDVQKLEFYLKVTSDETTDQVYDTFRLRFLNADGNPITDEDIMIADNTTKTDWLYITVDLNGMAEFADQDIQIQFEAVLNVSNITSFVIDSVSLNMICGTTLPTPTQTEVPTATPTLTQTPTATPTQTATLPPVYYIYLPVVAKDPTPTPTEGPTSTPRPSATPCPNHDPCPSYCSSDCSSDCSSQCPLDCIFDCLHCACIGHW